MDPILKALEAQFRLLDGRSRALIVALPPEKLFVPAKAAPYHTSCGEYLLRSAGTVERTFGGITTRLWDDPFEWTLPEAFVEPADLLKYLDEVEAARRRGFAVIGEDGALLRQLPAPERLTPLVEVLLDTITTASHFQGRAFAAFTIVTGEKPPRLEPAPAE